MSCILTFATKVMTLKRFSRVKMALGRKTLQTNKIPVKNLDRLLLKQTKWASVLGVLVSNGPHCYLFPLEVPFSQGALPNEGTAIQHPPVYKVYIHPYVNRPFTPQQHQPALQGEWLLHSTGSNSSEDKGQALIQVNLSCDKAGVKGLGGGGVRQCYRVQQESEQANKKNRVEAHDKG